MCVFRNNILPSVVAILLVCVLITGDIHPTLMETEEVIEGIEHGVEDVKEGEQQNFNWLQLLHAGGLDYVVNKNFNLGALFLVEYSNRRAVFALNHKKSNALLYLLFCCLKLHIN